MLGMLIFRDGGSRNDVLEGGHVSVSPYSTILRAGPIRLKYVGIYV
jgi:hypothetical protein